MYTRLPCSGPNPSDQEAHQAPHEPTLITSSLPKPPSTRSIRRILFQDWGRELLHLTHRNTESQNKMGSLCKTLVTLLLHTGVCLFPSSGSWWAWLWNKWPHFPPSACGVGEGIGTYVLSGFEVQCLHLGVGLSSANSVSILSVAPSCPHSLRYTNI